jgi:hypothetical protein
MIFLCPSPDTLVAVAIALVTLAIALFVAVTITHATILNTLLMRSPSLLPLLPSPSSLPLPSLLPP